MAHGGREEFPKKRKTTLFIAWMKSQTESAQSGGENMRIILRPRDIGLS